MPDASENDTLDDADKMLTAGFKSYGYDACGRTTSVTVGGNATTLDYDYEDRLTQITYPSTATNTFSYNGLDTRVGKVDRRGQLLTRETEQASPRLSSTTGPPTTRLASASGEVAQRAL